MVVAVTKPNQIQYISPFCPQFFCLSNVMYRRLFLGCKVYPAREDGDRYLRDKS